MAYRSETVNITRYTNGTLVKITPSADGFVSYDYNPDTNTGTFTPDTITLTATFGGDVHFGRWEYNTGGDWIELENGDHGIALNSSLLTVPHSCDLFGTTNSQVTFRCVGDNPAYYDTATITHEVDPLQVYRTTKTQIDQSNDKISLIASDEQLAYFSKASTFYSRYSNFEQTSQGFMQTVTNNYAQKSYVDEEISNVDTAAQGYANAVDAAAQGYADDAESAAKSYADGKFVTSSTYTTKMQQTDAAIMTQAGQITQIGNAVDAKAQTFMQATQPIGATVGDLWVNTSKNNEVSRYNGSSWVGVVNANAIVSQINQTAEQITISANKINLNGAISANGNFSISQAGDMTARNARFSGIIDVGGSADSKINVYNQSGTRTGTIDKTGLTFLANGVGTWAGRDSYSDTSTGTTTYYNRETNITNGEINISCDDMNGTLRKALSITAKKTADKFDTGLRYRDGEFVIAYNATGSGTEYTIMTFLKATQTSYPVRFNSGVGFTAPARSMSWFECVPRTIHWEDRTSEGRTKTLDLYICGAMVYFEAKYGSSSRSFSSLTIYDGLPAPIDYYPTYYVYYGNKGNGPVAGLFTQISGAGKLTLSGSWTGDTHYDLYMKGYYMSTNANTF